jgi:NAD+ synthase (glutamine-hydrolysing)
LPAGGRQWRRSGGSPELALWGYPARDLLLRPSLRQLQQQVLDHLAANLPAGLGLLLGIADPINDGSQPDLSNAAALVDAGRWQVVADKQLLPSYDVFDERRYFRSGSGACLLQLERQGRPWSLGLTICEDLWVDQQLAGQKLAGADPVGALQPLQPDLLLNLSASPFSQGKAALRQQLAAAAARRLGCPVVYVNQVGGNDELVFDGASFVVDAAGVIGQQLPCSQPALAYWDWSPTSSPAQAPLPEPSVLPGPEEQLFRALVLGVADYARKCGFRRALLGLSGGIDSALVAVIACAALGPEAVEALLMPSPYSSSGSRSDAEALAARLGFRQQTAPITALMGAFDDALTPALGTPPAGLTAENLQSRIRGTLLMALANQGGQLLLSTGNKSELAVGYCTLYGDMNGGLAGDWRPLQNHRVSALRLAR